MLASLHNKLTKMLYVVTLLEFFYHIMRSKICYIIDWRSHIIAFGIITTTG